MTLPTIHPNGTPRKQLIDRLAIASDALESAYHCMKATTPNVRDYGFDMIDKAIDEHLDRLRRVGAVKQELDELIRLIDAM